MKSYNKENNSDSLNTPIFTDDKFFIDNSNNDSDFEEINSFSENYNKNEFVDVFNKENKKAFKRAKKKEKKRRRPRFR